MNTCINLHTINKSGTMSTSRNKRKRPDIDPTAAASSSRRRSREPRAASSTEFDTNSSSSSSSNNNNNNKNEVEHDKTKASAQMTSNSSETTTNEKTAIGTPKSSQIAPQASQEHVQQRGNNTKENDSNSSISKESKPLVPITADSNKEPKKSAESVSTSTESQKSKSNGEGSAVSVCVERESLSATKTDTGPASSAQTSSTVSSLKPDTPASSSTTPNETITKESNKAVDASTAAQKPLDTREMRIRSLITHRKMLLKRIKLSRIAAEQRLQKVSDYQSTALGIVVDKKKLQNEKHSAGKGSASPKFFLGDEEEVAAFREMTKLATQAAKKSRSDGDSTAEKRTSLSLRRGSSVGKRMNAALSSLAPGTTASAATDTPINQPLHMTNTQQNSKGLPKSQQAAGVISSASTLKVTSAGASAQTTGQGHMVVQPNVIPSGKSFKTLAIMDSSRHATMKGDGQDKYDTSHKSRSSNSKGMKTSNSSSRISSSSAASRSDTATMPLHLGASVSLPQNRLAQTKVTCPEAVALRERRSKIESKLTALLERQTRSNELSVRGTSASATKKTTTTQSRKSRTKPPPWKLKSPTLLPTRRKTHWDTLLQEMAWMATDFIEERKWKVSCGRTLGSAVVTRGLAAVSPAKSKTGSKPSPKSSTEGGKGVCDKPAESLLKSDALYVQPTVDDTKAARNAAKRISCMLSELGNASIDAGSLAQTDEVHGEALNRFHLVCRAMETEGTNDSSSSRNDDGPVDNKAIEKTESAEVPKQLASEKSNEKSQTMVTSDEEEGGNELPLNKITDFIDTTSKKVAEARSQTSTQKKPKMVDRLKLSVGQDKAVRILEEVWKRSELGGAVLVGPTASGKTVTTCSILWKQMSHGPQMLVCPPANVIRWTHELSRFKGMRILSFGFTCGISSPFHKKMHSGKLKAGDLFICEYSSVPRALGMLSDDIAQFHSFVIDCRHPQISNYSISKEVASAGTVFEDAWNGHPELVSLLWWEDMLRFLGHGKARRMLIEFPGKDTFSLSSSGLGDRQKIDILALRAAWLVGPRVFHSSKVSIHRRVVTWARQRGKKTTADKVKRIRLVLSNVTEQFMVEVKGFATIADVSAFKKANFWWELRRCSLPPSQRLDYDNSCSEVRGSLSSILVNAHNRGNSIFHSFNALSSALFRLRRLCVHSKIQSIFNKSSVRCRLGPFYETLINRAPAKETGNGSCGSGIFGRAFSDSPSQPDASVAYSILEDSAKLRELVSILKFECGYDIDGDEMLESLLQPQNRPNGKEINPDGRRPKVAILAVLPEVQLLVSILLTSIGIKNELLLRATIGTSMPYEDKKSTLDCGDNTDGFDRSQTLALAWAEFQQVLAKFNSDTSDRESEGVSVSNILIASPASVAGDKGGLGVEMADMIICLDEDWSGRGELMMKHMVARCFLRKKVNESNRPRLVRLVCAETLEEKLLASLETEEKETNVDATTWPTDDSGHLLLPASSRDFSSLARRSKGAMPGNVFEFPGINLFRFRGECLSEVLLSSRPLPPRFGSASSLQFLPFCSSEKRGSSVETDSEYLFLAHFMEQEENRMFGATVDADALETRRFCIAPPTASAYPRGLMTRQDLSVITSRIYLERHVKSAVWAQLGVGSTGTPLALLRDAMDSGLVLSADSAPLAGINGDADLADAWHKSGVTCKPDDLAASLLFYENSGGVEEIPSDPSINKEVTKPPAVQQTLEASSSSEVAGKMSTPIGKENHIVVNSGPRINQYASSFSLSRDMNMSRDGSQGCEALVYFPPLFPMILDCSIQARMEKEALTAAKTPSLQSESYSAGHENSTGGMSCKRKEPTIVETSLVPSAKRLRFQQEQQSVGNVGLGSVSGQQDPLAPIPVVPPSQPPSAPSVQTTPSTASNPAITGSPDSVAVVSAGDIGNESRVISEEDSPIGKATTAFFGLDEDYGLLGSGAIPPPDDAVAVASNYFVSPGRHTIHSTLGTGDNFLSSSIPCDFEEADVVGRQDGNSINMNLMVLFRKKRPRGFAAISDTAGQFYRSAHGGQVGDASWTGANSILSGKSLVMNDINGSGSSKKFKKKASSQSVAPILTSAFSRTPSSDVAQSRPPGQATGPMQVLKGKDGLRHRILSSYVSRQIGTGLTMFESTSYRVASARVHQRITARLAKKYLESNSAYESGPGVPLTNAKQRTLNGTSAKRGLPETNTRRWTSIVKRLKKNATTGDAAKSLASSQRSALRRSLVSPCRVDFGPFRGGFLSLPSGMTGISPPRSRLGVSLPMGVKVPQSLREQIQLAWVSGDDQLLQDCAVRFGMNWMLVARAISGFEDVVVTPKSGNASKTNRKPRSVSRSARQCRDRWQALARSQPSLANEVRKSERVLRESALMRTDKIPGGDVNAQRIRCPAKPTDAPVSVTLLAKSSLFAENLTTENTPTGKSQLEDFTREATSAKQSVEGRMEVAPVASFKQGTNSAPLEGNQGVDGTVKPKRSMAILMRAKAKKQVIPMTIPGGVGTNMVRGSLPALVPSHPSHMQSVQASVAAQWSSGRTEMWPLQILDFADKQRAAAQRAASGSASGQRQNGPSQSSVTSSSTSRRQPVSSSSSSQSHRMSQSASSNHQRERPASFPPVPQSSARSQRAQAPSISPQRSVQGTPTAAVQAYSPPSSVPHHQIDETQRPSQNLPPSG